MHHCDGEMKAHSMRRILQVLPFPLATMAPYKVFHRGWHPPTNKPFWFQLLYDARSDYVEPS